ncbi:MAG: glycosyltransferase [Elusimicrobia bacterium]|nr:glycosyltransferase [Elusimicrobiota bacterium]
MAAEDRAPAGDGGAALKLTVSIVNWNVRDYLERCLESVFRHSGGLDLEVIVVDNASSDGSVAMVRERFPRVRVIESAENVGYGCGHNRTLDLAAGEYVVFLNPDTEMLPGTLTDTVRFMDAHPEAGAVTPREVAGPDDDDPTWHGAVELRGWRRRLWDLCLRVQALAPNRWTEGLILDTLAEWRGRARDGFSFAVVPYIEGGFVLARRGVLTQVGRFDPRFFYGHEGADLTGRMRLAGWKLCTLLNSRVVHHGSKSAERLGPEGLRRLRREWARRAAGVPGAVLPAAGEAALRLLRKAAAVGRETKRLLMLPFHFRAIKAADDALSPDQLASVAFDRTGGLISPTQVRSEIVGLLELLRERRPEVVIEIGTELGGTLFLFSRIAAPGATLVSVDLPGPLLGGGDGYCAARIPLYRSFALKGQTIHLVRGDSRDEGILARVQELLGGRKADLLFIDGDHSYDAVKSDFERYSPLVREGGMIAFHDIVPDPSTGDQESPRFWREIKAAHPVEEIVEDWDQKGFGIGLIPNWRPSTEERSDSC